MEIEEKPKILIVEDEKSIAQLERRALESSGYAVEIVDCGKSALEKLKDDNISLVLLDYRLPDMTGREIVTALGDRIQSLPVIIVTGHGDEQLAVEMLKMGVADYLAKGGETGFIHTLLNIIEKSIGFFTSISMPFL